MKGCAVTTKGDFFIIDVWQLLEIPKGDSSRVLDLPKETVVV